MAGRPRSRTAPLVSPKRSGHLVREKDGCHCYNEPTQRRWLARWKSGKMAWLLVVLGAWSMRVLRLSAVYSSSSTGGVATDIPWTRVQTDPSFFLASTASYGERNSSIGIGNENEKGSGSGNDGGSLGSDANERGPFEIGVFNLTSSTNTSSNTSTSDIISNNTNESIQFEIGVFNLSSNGSNSSSSNNDNTNNSTSTSTNESIQFEIGVFNLSSNGSNSSSSSNNNSTNNNTNDESQPERDREMVPPGMPSISLNSMSLNFTKASSSNASAQIMPWFIANKEGRISSDRAMEHYDALRFAAVAENIDGDRMMVYRACCGLGHRLSREAAAARYSRHKGFRLLWVEYTKTRISPGSCYTRFKPGSLDLSEYMFGPGPLLLFDEDEDDEQTYASLPTDFDSRSMEIRRYAAGDHGEKYERRNHTLIPNNVPDHDSKCFQKLPPSDQRAVGRADERFFRQLRSLFRFNHLARDFAEAHRFSERIVLGIHIRAGNGEQDDFVKKERGIEDHQGFANNTAKTLDELVTKIRSAQIRQGAGVHLHALPPLLFVATDDLAMVTKLENATRPYNISVVSFPQFRPDPGTGVSYNKQWKDSERCKRSWADQMVDMVLLGASDVLVAARYSSFSMSLPLFALFSDSLRYARRRTARENLSANDGSGTRYAHRMFCQSGRLGDGLKCFDDYSDWVRGRNPLATPTGKVDVVLPFDPFDKMIYGRCNSTK
ncbi:unnamed protein product [Pseudo-nitzschia multistriata]|uniref:Uncharacterized protein n=1 Tax=Pseudo-nitzschia multistriata TaxID=183589 RepID=A0A448ZPM6_9STRA|nr:unnamed protein product [Pseudo-nitzschia multistriata]